LKKDDILKNEFKFTMTKPGTELKNMSKLILILAFDIPAYSFSSFKLLKVDFMNGSSRWKKYASELARSGFVEVHLN
jgi:hypothetical protein